MKKLSIILALAGLALGLSAAPPAKAPKAGKAPKSGKLATVDSIRVAEARQPEFYERVEIPTPAGEVTEVSSIALLPGKRVAIGTRRGDVWVAEGAYEADVSKVKWTKFASNLH